MCSHDGLKVERVTLPDERFAKLTYPRFRTLLSQPLESDTGRNSVAIGAEHRGKPVGLALISPQCSEQNRRLWSVSVAASHRCRGVAKSLLKVGEDAVAGMGTRMLVAYHSSRMSNLEAYERLIKSAGWSPPKELEYRAAARAQWVFDGMRQWQYLLRRLEQKGYSTTGWADRTAQDRTRISELVADEATCPPHFDPNRWEGRAEPAISVAIRRHGDIVGWIIGERDDRFHDERVYHYSTGWVLPELSRTGWLIGGILDVCRRQAEVFGPDSLSICETLPTNLAMRKFIWERLRPAYVLWTDVRYVSEKRCTMGMSIAQSATSER